VERKLVKQGRNALTITLPAKWLQSKGLKAGNTITIEEKENNLEIKAEKKTIKKEITVDLRNQELSLYYHTIIAKYIQGYDIINIIHEKPDHIQEIAEEFLGMIIEEQTQNKTTLKNIIANPEENLDAILRRSAHILHQLSIVVAEFNNNKNTLENVHKGEKLLDYNLLYCLRYINKYERTEQTYRHFLLCSTLEDAGDRLKHIARNLDKKNPTLNQIPEIIKMYVDALFTKELKKTYSTLKQVRIKMPKNTFTDGQIFALIETLYNYIGFIIDDKRLEIAPPKI
jgi:phosphate uptake regulator